ncbi:MAG TPA: Ku protein [Thermoanaerobaculia bacterium]|nr:Ku protein [Thermoanaerobaculia bacterium]
MVPKAERDQDGDRPSPKRPAVGAFWSGTISFGLISVPVQLFPANRNRSVSLRMLDEDGTPLRRRYYCPAHDQLVEPDELARGFEVDDGEFVVVTDEELEAVAPGRSREIDLKRFVHAGEISPLFFERAYFLTPRGDSNKAYRLLAEVMERTGRAGIATFVMRNKEYLVAILAEEGILRAETLRFQDEVRDPARAGLTGDFEIDEVEAKRFEKAIEARSADELDPDELADEAGEALRDLAERKRKEGKEVVEAPAEASGEDGGDGAGESGDDEGFEEVDLLETIRNSLKSGNGAKRE